MKLCIHCQHFRDGHFHKVYVSPRCTVRGDDWAAYMRAHVCGLDGNLYEPKPTTEQLKVAVSQRPETLKGTEHDEQFNN